MLRRWFSGGKSKVSHYDALGVTPKATIAEIKAAYYRLSKKYHPDVNPGEEAAARFRAINDAYEIVGNAQTKKMYDKGVLDRPNLRYHQSTGDDGTSSRTTVTMPGHRPETIYDFDTWTKQHYGENFRRKQKDMYAARLKTHQRKERDEHWVKNAPLLLLSALVLCGVMLVMTPRNSLDTVKDRNKRDS